MSGHHAAGARNVEVFQCQAPAQANGYDCGLFSVAVASALCDASRHSLDVLLWNDHVLRLVSQSHVSALRRNVLQLIDERSLPCEERSISCRAL